MAREVDDVERGQLETRCGRRTVELDGLTEPRPTQEQSQGFCGV